MTWNTGYTGWGVGTGCARPLRAHNPNKTAQEPPSHTFGEHACKPVKSTYPAAPPGDQASPPHSTHATLETSQSHWAHDTHTHRTADTYYTAPGKFLSCRTKSDGSNYECQADEDIIFRKF